MKVISGDSMAEPKQVKKSKELSVRQHPLWDPTSIVQNLTIPQTRREPKK
jgi:hypothetical protein